MYRGFKKHAAETAAEIRNELGLSACDQLDPWALAEHLAIPVWSLSSYPTSMRAAVVHLRDRDASAFSGMLAFDGLRRVIVYNDAHALTRQRADIAHELAHALLLHQPHASAKGGPPTFDADQEDEASWLGGVLLVTDDYCLRCCREDIDIADAARHLGISQQLMQWRLNKSGAALRVSRARARRVTRPSA